MLSHEDKDVLTFLQKMVRLGIGQDGDRLYKDGALYTMNYGGGVYKCEGYGAMYIGEAKV